MEENIYKLRIYKGIASRIYKNKISKNNKKHKQTWAKDSKSIFLQGNFKNDLSLLLRLFAGREKFIRKNLSQEI
jgi:hypothetical protein